jgi:hypothetical protein
MSKERDLFDYLNLASNVTQNLQLGGVESELKQMREGQISRERAGIADAERQRGIRQAIWEATQGLEHAKKVKKEHPDKPVLFAYALEACPSVQFSTEDCDDWQDKKRLQSFCDELEDLKKEARAKISESDYEDVVKTSKAHRCLESLEEYIRLRRCYEQYDEVKKRLTSELDALKKQKSSKPFNALSFKSWKESAELDRAIAGKESELEACQTKSPYESDSFYVMLVRRLKEDGLADEGYSEAESQIRGTRIMNDRYLKLSVEFEFHSYDAAVRYRTELLEATKRFFKLNSVQEAAHLITGGEDEETQLKELAAQAPQAAREDTARNVTERFQKKQSGGKKKAKWLLFAGVFMLLAGFVRLVTGISNGNPVVSFVGHTVIGILLIAAGVYFKRRNS